MMVVTDSLMIPSTCVGLVIGKGGENIRSFQDRSQCKMVMIQDGEYARSSEKLLTIQGPRARVEEAKRLVKEFMEEHDKNGRAAGVASGSIKVEVTVPSDCVGLIIGRGGETIKRISAETNCRIHFLPEDTGQRKAERVCVFDGMPEEIQAAQHRVREIVEQVIRRTTPQTTNVVLAEGAEIFEVHANASKAGMIVGRGGEFLHMIIQTTGARVEINKGMPDNGRVKAFLISGFKEQINRARQIMVDKIGENNVSQLQPPTNVAVTYAQPQPTWNETYDPSVYYQNYAGVDPNYYYANMSQEEIAAAWSAYYQQCQDAAAAGQPVFQQPQVVEGDNENGQNYQDDNDPKKVNENTKNHEDNDPPKPDESDDGTPDDNDVADKPETSIPPPQ